MQSGRNDPEAEADMVSKERAQLLSFSIVLTRPVYFAGVIFHPCQQYDFGRS